MSPLGPPIVPDVDASFYGGWAASTMPDYNMASGVQLLVATTQYFFLAPSPFGGVSSRLEYVFTVHGTGLSNAFVFAYDLNGNLLAQSPDQSAFMNNVANNNAWGSAAVVAQLPEGPNAWVWLGIYFGGSVTSPSFAAEPVSLVQPPGMTAAGGNLRCGSLALANTSIMPATVDPTTFTVYSSNVPILGIR